MEIEHFWNFVKDKFPIYKPVDVCESWARYTVNKCDNSLIDLMMKRLFELAQAINKELFIELYPESIIRDKGKVRINFKFNLVSLNRNLRLKQLKFIDDVYDQRPNLEGWYFYKHTAPMRINKPLLFDCLYYIDMSDRVYTDGNRVINVEKPLLHILVTKQMDVLQLLKNLYMFIGSYEYSKFLINFMMLDSDFDIWFGNPKREIKTYKDLQYVPFKPLYSIKKELNRIYKYNKCSRCGVKEYNTDIENGRCCFCL